MRSAGASRPLSPSREAKTRALCRPRGWAGSRLFRAAPRAGSTAGIVVAAIALGLGLDLIVKNDIIATMNPDLAALVRKRREQLGWSQSDLARAMGSSPSRICKLEASDASVAPGLMLRALHVMETPLRVEIDSRRDVFADTRLSRRRRLQASARLLRRKHAERIAEREGVDAGDVEHVLFNLTLSPWQRLARSFQRAGLARLSSR
jgi:transcriptional regulator with XRE-family HTH domain